MNKLRSTFIGSVVLVAVIVLPTLAFAEDQLSGTESPRSAVSQSAAAEVLRDPTTPLNYRPRAQEQQKPSFKLQAIFSNNTGKTAVINGRSLTVGESLEGWVLTTIDKHGVVLRANSQSHRLGLQQPIVKR